MEGGRKGRREGGREWEHTLYSKHSPALTTLYTGGWFCILAIGSFTSTCPSGKTPCKPVMGMQGRIYSYHLNTCMQVAQNPSLIHLDSSNVLLHNEVLL